MMIAAQPEVEIRDRLAGRLHRPAGPTASARLARTATCAARAGPHLRAIRLSPKRLNNRNCVCTIVSVSDQPCPGPASSQGST